MRSAPMDSCMEAMRMRRTLLLLARPLGLRLLLAAASHVVLGMLGLLLALCRALAERVASALAPLLAPLLALADLLRQRHRLQRRRLVALLVASSLGLLLRCGLTVLAGMLGSGVRRRVGVLVAVAARGLGQLHARHTGACACLHEGCAQEAMQVLQRS
jgi:hypothetical protein